MVAVVIDKVTDVLIPFQGFTSPALFRMRRLYLEVFKH